MQNSHYLLDLVKPKHVQILRQKYCLQRSAQGDISNRRPSSDKWYQKSFLDLNLRNIQYANTTSQVNKAKNPTSAPAATRSSATARLSMEQEFKLMMLLMMLVLVLMLKMLMTMMIAMMIAMMMTMMLLLMWTTCVSGPEQRAPHASVAAVDESVAGEEKVHHRLVPLPGILSSLSTLSSYQSLRGSKLTATYGK